MNKDLLKASREAIGGFLKETRESKCITLYRVSKDSGLRFETIKTIESGCKNYTIDSLLDYLRAIGMEIVIKEREA